MVLDCLRNCLASVVAILDFLCLAFLFFQYPFVYFGFVFVFRNYMFSVENYVPFFFSEVLSISSSTFLSLGLLIQMNPSLMDFLDPVLYSFVVSSKFSSVDGCLFDYLDVGKFGLFHSYLFHLVNSDFPCLLCSDFVQVFLEILILWLAQFFNVFIQCAHTCLDTLYKSLKIVLSYILMQ